MSADQDDPSAEAVARKLIGAARSGCRESLNELLGQYRRYVWRIAAGALGTELRRKTTPSTIAQDTLTRAFRSFARFGGTTEQQFCAWLRVQCNRVIADSARKLTGTRRKNKPPAVISVSVNPAVEAALVQTPDDSPASLLDLNEKRQVVRQAMDKLSEQDREVIKLRHWEELPNIDVAARLGVSEPAAQARYTRAIRRLRDALKDDPSL